jgi:cytochrome P450
MERTCNPEPGHFGLRRALPGDSLRPALLPSAREPTFMLTLHQQPGRADIYRAKRPFWVDENLHCMCVVDPQIVEAVFRSDKFNVIFFADQYRYITEHTPLDFGATIVALDHVPLANEGERHKQTRSEIATVIGADARQTMKLMEDFVATLTERLFRAGNEIDLVEEFATPIVMRLFSLWLGVDHNKLVDEHTFSQVFDMKMSLNRRKKVNRNVESLRRAFAERRDQISTSPEFATAMNILGNDALKGSLSLSLWEVFSRNPGGRLDKIVYPESMPSTGVPYIERVAKDDVEIAGMRVEKGQRVRLYTDATSFHVTGEDRDLLFGKGKHVCLGKPMSLAIWRSLTVALGSIPLRFTLGGMKLRDGDYAFSYVEQARIRFHE